MKSLIFLSIFMIGTIIIVPSAFADMKEYTPTQPNALVSYNESTNQVNLTWDFDTLPADTICLLKTDVRYNENINKNPHKNNNGSPSFTPIFYSAVSSTPVTFEFNIYSAEAVPCTGGKIRIDIDTIMNHSENVNNYQEVQIFFTFYVPEYDGTFGTWADLRIDEVFVMYSEIRTFDDGAKSYGCDEQIGNTIYIDTSGVYGNDGYNCDKYLSLTSNQCVDIGRLSGISDYGIHKTNYDLLYKVVEPTTTQEQKLNNGGGCSSDCTPPTMGIDKIGFRMVDDGLILNGETFDVSNFKDHMSMQYTEINKENHLQVKIYENSGAYAIDMIQFGIVQEIGSPMNLAEPRWEINIDNFSNDITNASLKGVELIDSKGIISEYKVIVTLVDCMVDSSQQCLNLDIFWSFAKVPEHNVLLLNGWDNKKNSFNNYFNDGITVIDPNYVEPTIPEPYKYECMDPELDTIMNGGNRNNCHWRAANLSW